MNKKKSLIGQKLKRRPSHKCQKKRKRKGDLVIGFKRREKRRLKTKRQPSHKFPKEEERFVKMKV